MAVPSPFPPDKSALRAEGLRRRRAVARSLTPALRAELERALADRVVPHLAAAKTIAAYHPLRDEISPYPILERAGRARQAVFPWFARRDAPFVWRAGPAVEPGPWGVLQPAAGAPAAAPDFVLVPLVLADRAGRRIGHGKGHYDRALARLREAGPVFALGIGWDEQLLDRPLAADPWDVTLDAVATPRQWVDCR